MRAGRTFIVAAITALAAIFIPSAALAYQPASSVPTLPTSSHPERVGMVVLGYDMTVANQHGYELEKIDGQIHSVKVSDKPISQSSIKIVRGAAPADQPVVHGDCGSAFLYYAAQGDLKAQVYTGFDLTTFAPMVAFKWNVKVQDAIGTGGKLWNEPDVGYSWDDHWMTSHGVGGSSTAWVSEGIAYLADGEACGDLVPYQTTQLY